MKPVLILLLSIYTTLLNAQQSLKNEIDFILRNNNFNGNVLLLEKGKEVYKAAIGFADGAKTKKLSTAHRFHIGSIAKEFNAVGIMLLLEQGKLKLTDKAGRFLPEFPSWINSIEVRHLLAYTSGIPDVRWNSVKSDADNINDLMKVQKLEFEPGTQYAYNNNNVFLQRRIIEKITGMSFEDFVEQQLLKPSMMSHSLIDPTEKEPLIARAFNNTGAEDGLIIPISGWVATTLDDMYKWSQQIIKYKIISPASTRFLLIPESPSEQSGLGFDGKMEGNSITNFVHDGTARNYQALLVCQPKKGRTLILLSNHKQNNLGEINLAIQNLLDKKGK